jgi:hypothetical protein
MPRTAALPRRLLPALCALVSCGVAAAATTDEIRALVEAGRSQAAYEACTAADTPVASDLDLWCGIAAVDVGRAGVGLLALERHSLSHPGDVRGRLELARAYFHAGDDRRARNEFEAVLATNPPAAVRAGIERYLDALTAREAEYTTRVTGYVEGGVGYDSNANAGVAQSDIGLPVLGRVFVIDAGVEKHDSFGYLGGGVQVNHPLRPGVTGFASAWGNGTFYGDRHEFDLASLGAAVGGRYQAGPDLYALTYAHAEVLLDQDRFRRTDGVGFEWRHRVSELATVSVAPQYARLAYAGENAARDADLVAVAAGYRRWWLSAWQPVMNLTVYGGDEHNRRDHAWLGRSLYGVGADVTVSPSAWWALSAGASYQHSDYDGDYPLLATTRRDDYLAFNAGASYLFARNWSVRVDYQYARNESNLALFDWDRHVVGVKLRYDFR